MTRQDVLAMELAEKAAWLRVNEAQKAMNEAIAVATEVTLHITGVKRKLGLPLRQTD